MSPANRTTKQKLDAILADIEDAPLRESLFQNFHLINPVQFAKLLHSLDIPDTVKSHLLALKVGQPPTYKGENLEVLVEKAMTCLWSRLAEQQ